LLTNTTNNCYQLKNLRLNFSNNEPIHELLANYDDFKKSCGNKYLLWQNLENEIFRAKNMG
jgi:hypothetical protein